MSLSQNRYALLRDMLEVFVLRMSLSQNRYALLRDML
jgi:hypothetical protein